MMQPSDVAEVAAFFADRRHNLPPSIQRNLLTRWGAKIFVDDDGPLALATYGFLLPDDGQYPARNPGEKRVRDSLVVLHEQGYPVLPYEDLHIKTRNSHAHRLGDIPRDPDRVWVSLWGRNNDGSYRESGWDYDWSTRDAKKRQARVMAAAANLHAPVVRIRRPTAIADVMTMEVESFRPILAFDRAVLRASPDLLTFAHSIPPRPEISALDGGMAALLNVSWGAGGRSREQVLKDLAVFDELFGDDDWVDLELPNFYLMEHVIIDSSGQPIMSADDLEHGIGFASFPIVDMPLQPALSPAASVSI